MGTNGIVVYNDATIGNVSIHAAFKKGGSEADTIIDESTYFSLFLCGIENAWSGSFGTYEISTHARESSKGLNASIVAGSGTLNEKKNIISTICLIVTTGTISLRIISFKQALLFKQVS